MKCGNKTEHKCRLNSSEHTRCDHQCQLGDGHAGLHRDFYDNEWSQNQMECNHPFQDEAGNPFWYNGCYVICQRPKGHAGAHVRVFGDDRMFPIPEDKTRVTFRWPPEKPKEYYVQATWSNGSGDEIKKDYEGQYADAVAEDVRKMLTDGTHWVMLKLKRIEKL